jgi:hypothetical protein
VHYVPLNKYLIHTETDIYPPSPLNIQGKKKKEPDRHEQTRHEEKKLKLENQLRGSRNQNKCINPKRNINSIYQKSQISHQIRWRQKKEKTNNRKGEKKLQSIGKVNISFKSFKRILKRFPHLPFLFIFQKSTTPSKTTHYKFPISLFHVKKREKETTLKLSPKENPITITKTQKK